MDEQMVVVVVRVRCVATDFVRTKTRAKGRHGFLRARARGRRRRSSGARRRSRCRSRRRRPALLNPRARANQTSIRAKTRTHRHRHITARRRVHSRTSPRSPLPPTTLLSPRGVRLPQESRPKRNGLNNDKRFVVDASADRPPPLDRASDQAPSLGGPPSLPRAGFARARAKEERGRRGRERERERERALLSLAKETACARAGAAAAAAQGGTRAHGARQAGAGGAFFHSHPGGVWPQRAARMRRERSAVDCARAGPPRVGVARARATRESPLALTKKRPPQRRKPLTHRRSRPGGGD